MASSGFVLKALSHRVVFIDLKLSVIPVVQPGVGSFEEDHMTLLATANGYLTGQVSGVNEECASGLAIVTGRGALSRVSCCGFVGHKLYRNGCRSALFLRTSILRRPWQGVYVPGLFCKKH